MNIRSQAARLADLLARSIEYNQYLEAKKRLEEDVQNAYALSELRSRQLQLRLAEFIGEDVIDASTELDKIFSAYCDEPVINDFLYAEGRFSRLLAEIQTIFGEKLDVWTEFEIPEQYEYINKNLN